MTSWTERMHRRAATLGTVVAACRLPAAPYPRRIEKVKFGFPLEQVCKNNIPGPLLVLILKLNKEAPYRKDVFRAPGHQNNIKKLVHFLQNGRLVNLDSFSIHTIASVLKKFLRKIPEGIFGLENEQRLFELIQLDDSEAQREGIHRLILSLPVHTQHLLVLLFGTFRVIATHAERMRTGMTSEALGVSAAPSFFQSCVTGRDACHEDVLRFKVATRIMKFLIDNFGVSDLFGRDNYEYYARITGRVLRVERDWIFSFRYPPDGCVSQARPASGQRQRLTREMEAFGARLNLEALSERESCRSTPARLHLRGPAGDEADRAPLTVPENTLGTSCPRLSVSLEEDALCQVDCPSGFSDGGAVSAQQGADGGRCLSRLPLVHERQTERMRTRTAWFLTPQELRAAAGDGRPPALDGRVSSSPARGSLPSSAELERRLARRAAGRDQEGGLLRRSSSSDKERRPVRRSSSRDKERRPRRSSSRDRLERRAVRRSSSQRDKENGAAPARAAPEPAVGLRRSLSELSAGAASAYRPRF